MTKKVKKIASISGVTPRGKFLATGLAHVHCSFWIRHYVSPIRDMIVLWGSVPLPRVIQVLFDELQLDTRLPDKSKSISRTIAGREKSTSEAVLKRLSAVHPLPALVLQHRQVKP